MSASHVLKLNADYTPISVIPWSEGLMLVMDDKADLVEEFDRVVRSASAEFQVPAVIRLRKYAPGLGKVGCSRENVLARDRYTCQYCGLKPQSKTGKPVLEDLTIDHVVPRASAVRGNVWLPWLKEWKAPTSWENLVCACRSCNGRKGSKPLAQSGMTLRGGHPKAPDRLGRIAILLNKHRIPDEWKDYLPEDSGWRSYWDGELED